MPSVRISYHTKIKLLAREGLLASPVLQQIPRSNIHRWRRESPGKYQLFGFSDLNNNEVIFQAARHRNAFRIFAAYVRIVKTLAAFAHSLPNFHKIVKAHSVQVVNLIRRVSPSIGLRRTLRFFDISVPTFRLWSLQSATKCFQSLTDSCFRIFPNQLSRPQIALMKELSFDPRFAYWPVSSIALHARRNNLLPINLNTWYKYALKLGLKRPLPASRRKKNCTGIRASRPHQLWHADITSFVTPDGIRHFLYLVVDNFSRKILTWLMADKVSAVFRQNTIEAALQKVGSEHSITLITEGGPENKFQGLSYKLNHQRAMVDIQYSNSLIEAHNKILKYNYLYRMNIPDGNHLQKILPSIIDDFNNRPHISLDGLTPNEAEQNLLLDRDRIARNVMENGIQRRAYNKLHRCSHC